MRREGQSLSETSEAPIALAWDETEADQVAVQRRAMRPLSALVVLSAASTLLLMGVYAERFRSTPGVSVVILGFQAVMLLWMWRRPAARVAARKRAAMLALGPHRLVLDGGGLSLRGEGIAWRVGWPMVARMTQDRGGLWVGLSTGVVMRVPPRVLAGLDLARARAWRAAPIPPADLPYSGTATWDLTGELTAADYGAGVGLLTSALQRRARRVLLGLYVAFLLVNLAPFLASRDLRSASLVPLVVPLGFGWAVLRGPTVLQSWRMRLTWRTPGRVPIGPFRARLDPDGIWIRTSVGTAWYSWSWVGQVERSDRVVALVLGLVAVLPIPCAAVPDVDRLVADVKTWIAASPRLRGGAPAPGRGSADGADPFAAPEA